jgi:hypothetical protein
MVINMTIGGLGIAYYRVLYIKASNWVKYVIGEMRLLFLISSAGFLATLLFTVSFSSGQGSRAVLDICLGYYNVQVKKTEK